MDVTMDCTTLSQLQSRQAVGLFRRAMLRGWFYRFCARLARRTARLLDLDEALHCAQLQNCYYTGIHSVLIDSIRGTQDKPDAFDAAFHPVKESSRDRWLGIAREKLCGHDLPPVDLVNVDGIYYVRDGHHRISVARSLGQAYIDAEVTTVKLKLA